MKPQVSVVIPVFNQWSLTERCLGSMVEHSSVASELVLVNNGSSDETAVKLPLFMESFEKKGWVCKILTLEENIGFGRAVNRGITASTGDFVAVVSNDTWLMPDWDRVLLDKSLELEAVMLGPYYDESPFDPVMTPLKAKRFIRRNKGRVARQWVSIVMLFNREKMKDVDWFDERFFLTYEDTDLKERFDRAGLKYFQTADCFIWHRSMGTRRHDTSNYAKDALEQFIQKWGFDPQPRDHTWKVRFARRWKKIRNKLGYF